MIYFLGDLITFFCRASTSISTSLQLASLLRQNPWGSTFSFTQEPIFQKTKICYLHTCCFWAAGKWQRGPQVPLVHFVIEQKAKEILPSVMTSSLKTLFKKGQKYAKNGLKWAGTTIAAEKIQGCPPLEGSV